MSPWLGASLVSGVVLATMIGPVRAETEVEVQGRLSLDYFHRPRAQASGDGFGGFSASGRAIWRTDTAWSAVAELRLHAPDLGRHRLDAHARWREGYLQWQGQAVQVRLGRQIVAWGRADGLNPTDNLSPRDYAILLPFEEDQREGGDGLRLDYFIDSEQTLTAYLSPRMRAHRLPWPDQGRGVVQDAMQHGGVGLRYDRRGDAIDWSLSAYRGGFLQGEWRVDAQALRYGYPAVQVLGIDAAAPLGPVGWRAELARVTRRGARADTAWRDYSYLVTGVEYNFAQDWNLNLQGLWRTAGQVLQADSASSVIEQAAARLNALAFAQTRAHQHGYTLRLGKKAWNETLEFEWLRLCYLGPQSCADRLLSSWTPRDGWKWSLGSEWYRGPVNSYFGAQRERKTTYAELRYSF